MQGISSSDADFMKLDVLINRIHANSEFSDLEYQSYDEDSAHLNFVYRGQKFSADILSEKPQFNEMLIVKHDLTSIEHKRLQSAGLALTVKMLFGEDNLMSFHLQVKLIYTMLPNICGIVDHASFSILSGRWVRLTSQSSIPPAPSYLYRIHAVNDEDSVWLHTHGLNRCGSIELEIIDAFLEDNSYRTLGTLMEILATRAIDGNLKTEPEEPIPVGAGIVVTWKKWEEAIKEFDGLGTTDKDRDSHRYPSGVLYLYMEEEGTNKKLFFHPNQAVKHIQDNPLFYLSNKETKRMSDLAKERLEYFKAHCLMEGNKGLIKAGLLVDEEYQQEDEANKEHLWFEITDQSEGLFKGILLNQPYHIAALNEGDELNIKVDDISDWIIYTQEESITPDRVYLLEQDKGVPQKFLEDREALIALLDDWHDKNHPDKVIEICSQLENPDYEIVSSYARALNNLGDFQGAIDKLMEVEEEGLKDARWHYKLAYAYDSLNDHDKCLACLNKALAIDPHYAPIYIQMGFVQDKYGHYQEAYDAIRKGLEVDADQVNYSGDEREYLRECMKDWENKIHHEEQVKLYHSMVERFEQADYTGVISCFEAISDPYYQQAMLTVEAHIHLGAWKAAFRLLKEWEESGKGNSQWHFLIAQVYEGEGLDANAVESRQKAFELKEKEDSYIQVLESDDNISLCFYIEKDKIMAIGKKMGEINDQAYMNGYNWEAFFRYYLVKVDKDLADNIEHDPEAGMYAAYFTPDENGQNRAKRFEAIITDLIENENKLFTLIEVDGDKIEWD